MRTFANGESYGSVRAKLNQNAIDQSNSIVGSFTRWQAAKARGAANPARFMVLADSNGTGAGAGDSGAELLVNASTNSWPRQFARLAGFRDDGFYGDGNVPSAGAVTAAQYDPRIGFGAGWADFNQTTILGGRMLYSLNGSNNALLTFTPINPFDSFKITYPTLPSGTTLNRVFVDGTQVGSYNEGTGASGIGHFSFNVARGTHTIGIDNSAVTTSGYVSAIQTYDSTSAAPILIHATWYGAIASNFLTAANGWESLFGIQDVAADYTILPIITNDSSAGTALATYQAAMETLVSTLAATSDGCICVSFASNNAPSLNGDFDARAQMLRNLARSYGWSFFDMRDVYGYSWAKATANGFVYDTSHPNRAGYTAMTAKLYAFLTAAGL